MGNKSNLTERQGQMLDMIRDFVLDNGYPPTIRQIGKSVDISSTSVVTYNLDALQRKGYLVRDRDVSRGLRIIEDQPDAENPSLLNIPFLGAIAAGQPIPIPENDFSQTDSEYVAVTSDLISRQGQANTGGLYALRVKGDSMIDALIGDGDIVIVHHQPSAENGDMIVAWLKEEKETTLKSFFLEADKQRVRLQPRNPTIEPIYCHPSNLEIQGKVIGVIRRFE